MFFFLKNLITIDNKITLLNLLKFLGRCKKLTLISPENVPVKLLESDAASVTSDLSCFSTGEPFITAECVINDGSASWANITWHPCDMEKETIHTRILKRHEKSAITMENVKEVAVNLSSETKDPTSLSKEDMTYATVILEKITDVEKLDISVIKCVLSAVSNLMNLDRSKLGSFHFQFYASSYLYFCF